MMAQDRIDAAGKHGGHQAVGCRLNIHRHDAIRTDGGDRRGGIVFVRLGLIGKADRNEGGGPPVLAKLPHGALGQKARGQIDATADTEHIGRLPAVDEIGRKKRNALLDFLRGVEIGLNSKLLDDR